MLAGKKLTGWMGRSRADDCDFRHLALPIPGLFHDGIRVQDQV